MEFKKTKIVATISDLKCDVEFLTELHKSGVNVFRLNTAHQMPQDTLKIVNNIRAVSNSIAILVDTKGPEIRTRQACPDQILEKDSIVKIKYGDDSELSTKDMIFVSHDKFVYEIGESKIILIDDGDIELEVIEKNNDELLCKVKNRGAIKSNKSINVPGASFSLSSLTKKDKLYVKFCAENSIDFIAHSFVRNKKDVEEIQIILNEMGSACKIIAKIENKEGVENLDEILDCVYGIMVARGDLAIEIPAEKVPVIQKKIIQKCRARAKPVITATQMLQSMIENPRPTRAEISDVANAIFDGTDAIMLSGESAFGKYPIEAVKVMSKIALEIEKSLDVYKSNDDLKWNNLTHKFLAESAIKSRISLPVKAIFAATSSGATPRLLSSFRGQVKIYAETSSLRVMRELALVWGVNASYTENTSTNTDELVGRASKDLISKTNLKDDDLVLFIGSTPGKTEGADFIEIKTIKHFIE